VEPLFAASFAEKHFVFYLRWSEVTLSQHDAHLHRLHIRTEVHCRRQSEQLLGKKPRCFLVHVAQTNQSTPPCQLILQVFESLNLEDCQTRKSPEHIEKLTQHAYIKVVR
jgi:hypothetical protein